MHDMCLYTKDWQDLSQAWAAGLMSKLPSMCIPDQPSGDYPQAKQGRRGIGTLHAFTILCCQQALQLILTPMLMQTEVAMQQTGC